MQTQQISLSIIWDNSGFFKFDEKTVQKVFNLHLQDLCNFLNILTYIVEPPNSVDIFQPQSFNRVRVVTRADLL